jgi:hypothetical protein
MKRLSKTLALRLNNFTRTYNFISFFRVNKTLLFFSTIFFSMLFLTGCKKDATGDLIHYLLHKGQGIKYGFLDADADLPSQTVKELRAARAASAKYRNIQNAIDDGYTDIDVVVEHMGFHYMKDSLADDKFEVEKPEILVYNKKENGKIELVAVEYAVPIPLTPDTAPEGFTGNKDVWTFSTEFNLWLLHAWVWEYNPDGVFNPTNPLVHLH